MQQLKGLGRIYINACLALAFYLSINTSAIADASISSETIYAAVISKNEIQKIGGHLDGITQPTPEPPNLFGSSDGYSGIIKSVRQLYHINHFNKQLKSYDSGIVVNRIDEYKDESTAKSALNENIRSLQGRLNNPITDTNGEVYGDETIYVKGTFGSQSYTANAAFFRVGRLISYIRINTQDALSINEAQLYPIGKYVAPVAIRMNKALSGGLRPILLPKRVASLLPPNSSYNDFGDLVGAVPITPETWASVEEAGTEAETIKLLTSGGSTKIGYFSIQARSNPSILIDGVIFPMSSTKSADKFYAYTTNGIDSNLAPLPADITSIFTNDSGYYQLNFKKGKFVAYLDCLSTSKELDAFCESSLRNISSEWFNKLK